MDMFPSFAHLVATSFQQLVKGSVFVADIDGDALWATYLATFPDGTNPLYLKRTEHDCGCCKQFIRRAGGVIAIKDGKVSTIWDKAAEKAGGPYNVVAKALRQAILDVGVRDLFRVGLMEMHFGAKQTHSLDKDSQKVVTWDHFHTGTIPANLRVANPGTDCGNYRTTVQVFERGLVELSPDALATVLSLIQSNSIYRGAEHEKAIAGFQKDQRTFLALSPNERSLFLWSAAESPSARFRNTVIGTLVQDLSSGIDLEAAVKSFETKVAPQNYKRTTAVVTPAMVKKAMEAIEALGLEPALERRLAVLSDVSVNDVLWVDGAAKPLMKGGLGDVLMKHATAAKSQSASKDADQAEIISLDDFMAKILPDTQSLEILFSGAHLGNLMTLTAPVNPEPKQLFRWDNDFAWSYRGGVADSIREKVKKAGGKVDGAELRISLSWFNYDDLDLHVFEPKGGEISFRNKRGGSGGILDVDMNAGSGQTREAVENIVWSNKPPDGSYLVVVNNFSSREKSNPGFVIEVENCGKTSHYSFNKQVRNQENITVVTLKMKNGSVQDVKVGEGITTSHISQDVWNLTTEQYIKVDTVMLSPNYWGNNAVGNKHVFFVLNGAKSDEDTRGIYNEFLHPRLEPHRKVFELIGDKTKCKPTEGHMAGLGFSSTKKDSFLIRAQQGKKLRIFNIHL